MKKKFNVFCNYYIALSQNLEKLISEKKRNKNKFTFALNETDVLEEIELLTETLDEKEAIEETDLVFSIVKMFEKISFLAASIEA